jgi:hypothetical protein
VDDEDGDELVPLGLERSKS